MTWFRIPTAAAFLLAVLFAAPDSGLAQNQKKKPMWSYEGKTGPTHWGKLSSEYATCRKGKRQSPINLKNAERRKKPSLKIKYGSSQVTVVNRKRSTQVNTTGGQLTLGSRTYRLQQFHVHTPAEHTIRGNRRAAEIHLVHRAPNKNELAVIALLVRQGGEKNPALRPLVQGVEKGRKKTMSNYNVRSLFPQEWRSSYYRYKGSLTTPPCTENVRWVVLSTPIEASKKQLKAIRARHKGNNRPIQPRNDRKIRRVSSN